MSRTLACLALLLLTSVTAAQQPGDPIRLTVYPEGLTTPAQKYRLLPEGRDLVPGNAAVLYYRAMTVFAENATLLDELNSGIWDKWLEMPLAELPLDEVSSKLEIFQRLFRQLDQAALRRHCDWQLNDRPEGIGLILPEIQKVRNVTRVLAVRVRYHVAGRRYAEAVQVLGTGYAMARHLGEGPTIIHVLVAAAIAHILDYRLEEMLQQRGAPNLYWALTVLPRPYFDPQPAIDQDEGILERTWPMLKRLEDGPLTAAQIHEMQQQTGESYRTFGFKAPTSVDVLAQTFEQARNLPTARKVLLADGLSAEQVDAMLPFQVVALYSLREFRRAWEDYVPWLHVAEFTREAGYQRARNRMTTAAIRLEKLVLNPAGVLANGGFLGPPAYDKVYNAMGRTDRRFACLRCVEALRLYAANHSGQLPASLKDVTEVPVPADPVTDLPFVYEVHGDKAKLSCPVRPGEKPIPYYTMVFEVSLAR
jgi:hypothetical protein